MKIVIFNNPKEVSDVVDSKEAIITRDGAKLITFGMTGTNELSAVMGVIVALVKAMDGYSDDKTLYIHGTSLSTVGNESHMRVVIGISGVTDLEVKLNALNGNVLKTPAPTSDPVPVVAQAPMEQKAV